MHGLTLLELLVSIAILAILTSLAVPSMSRMLSSSATASHASNFLADLRLARSEAISRGVNVIMCRVSDPSATSPSCTAASSGNTDWSTGWIVFVDDNGDSKHDADEQLLRVQSTMTDSGGIMAAGATDVSSVRFRPTGRASGGSAATIKFTAAAGAAASDPKTGKTVCISTLGRARLAGDGSVTCSG